MSSCRTRDIPKGDSGLGIEGVPGGISGDNEI